MDFVEEKDKDTLPKDMITTTSCSANEILDKVVREKWAQNEFVNVFEPFYMRKSQAERNNEI
jgi:tRNA A37 threonylcarbamoyladenosine modification protein TsaB